jgi:hypothetical protein
MTVNPPRVPRAAQVASNASKGPRVLPGVYTLRLTSGSQVAETKLEVGLDRRASITLADRKAQFDAVMRAHALFGEMSDLVERIEAAEHGAEARLAALAKGDTLAGRLGRLVARLSDARRKIVATKEGGAITGEERIREHLDTVYGALIGWEGRPARYQLDRVEALRRELNDVRQEFETVLKRDVPAIDRELAKRKLGAIARAVAPVQALAGWAPEQGGELSARLLRCLRRGGAECQLESAAARQERD